MSDIDFTIWKQYDPNKVQVLGINNGEAYETTVNFINTFGLTFPVLRDQNSTAYWKYQVRGITPYPRDVIIDQNGVVRYLHSEYDPQYMVKTIDQLLVTGIKERTTEKLLPGEFKIDAFPNPFNNQTTVRFTAPNSSTWQLVVTNINGEIIRKESLTAYQTGQTLTVKLNFRNEASGIYFITVQGRQAKASSKVVLIK